MNSQGIRSAKLLELVGSLRTTAAEGKLDQADRIAHELCSDYAGQESLGFIYFARRDLADKQFGQVVSRLLPLMDWFPEESEIPALIAQAYIQLNQLARAEIYLKIALELDPESGPINFELGRVLSKGRRDEEAAPYLRKAAQILPPNAEIAFKLGESLVFLNQLEEADKWMSQARELAPDNRAIITEYEDIKKSTEGTPNRQKFVRWPEGVQHFADIGGVMRDHILRGYDTRGFILRPGMRVVTQGSCFARHLANSFQRYPLEVRTVPFGEEYNNTYSNLTFARWLAEGEVDEATAIVAESMGAEFRDKYINMFRAADLYVFTMGVAPAFFDRQTGEFQMPSAAAASKTNLIRRSDFRTTTVEENVANVTRILDIIRGFNPHCQTVLSVSPVPLASTSEFPSAIIADCVSKSTLRVAAHQLTQNRTLNALYWPSFEATKWVGAHHGRVYGNDDGSSIHLDVKAIDQVIDNFMRVFASPDLTAASGPQPPSEGASS